MPFDGEHVALVSRIRRLSDDRPRLEPHEFRLDLREVRVVLVRSELFRFW